MTDFRDGTLHVGEPELTVRSLGYSVCLDCGFLYTFPLPDDYLTMGAEARARLYEEEFDMAHAFHRCDRRRRVMVNKERPEDTQIPPPGVLRGYNPTSGSV